MKIEVLGPGCPKCKKLFEHAEKAVKDAGIHAEVTKVEDIQKIIDAGVMMTPALVINGEVKSSGRVLSVEEIKKMING